MPITKYTGFANTFDTISRKFYDADSISAEFVARSLSSFRDSLNNLQIDYSDFSKHIYFNNAELRTKAAIKKIVDYYPIGLSGQHILLLVEDFAAWTALSAINVAAADNFIFQCNGFEKYVLNYLAGVTGNTYLNSSPTLTASASAENGKIISIIGIARRLNNSLLPPWATLSASLSSLATSYDAGLNTLQLISATASDFDITYFDDGEYVTNRTLPSQRIEYVNRSSDMTKWLPEAYSIGDTEDNLIRFMSVAGSIFDDIKLYIDQFSSVNHVTYDNYERVPDGLIQNLIAKHFGFELIDTLLRQDISSYLRRNSSKIPLYQVSFKLWNRVLNNLIYLYKKKGTLESVKALIRIYGIPDSYFQIDDFSFHPEPTTQTKIDYKNVRVLNFTGNDKIGFDVSTSGYWNILANQDFTIEMRLSSSSITSLASLFFIGDGSDGLNLYWNNQSFILGTLSSSIESYVQTIPSSSASLRNALSTNFVNIFGIRSGSNLIIRSSWIDESSGSSVFNSVSSVSAVSSYAINPAIAGTSSGDTSSGWVGDIHEVKFFKKALNELDIRKHTFNYESMSWMNTGGPITDIVGNWKLKENVILSGDYNIVNSWTLSSGLTGIGLGSLTSRNAYKMVDVMKKETSFTNIGEFADDNVDIYINNNGSKFGKSNILHVGFRPIQAVNNDILNVLGDLNVSSVIGDPINFYGSFSGYPYGYRTETISASQVFSRYSSSINSLLGSRIDINNYISALENLAPLIEGIMNGIGQLIPARTILINRGVTIEQHLLESSRFHTNTPTFSPESLLSNTIVIEQIQQMSHQDITAETLTWEESWSGDTKSTFDFTYVNQDQIPNLNSTVADFRIVSNKAVQPYHQDVFDPLNTTLITSINRNFLRTDSTISDWTTSITGTVFLTRSQTGKIITSQQDCLRLEVPFSSSGSPISATDHWFNIYVNGNLLESSKTTFDFTIQNKTGLYFLITRKTKYLDLRIGVVELRITNLLSGVTNKLPIFMSVDESGLGGVLELINTISV